MKAFLYGVLLQWKLDLRNKDILLTYYIMPLIFFGFMGGIIISIDPSAKGTLIQALTLLGVTMGAILGAPTSLVKIYGSEIKKAYKVGGIPLWMGAVNNFLSAFVNLFIVSVIIFIFAPIVFGAAMPTNKPMYFLSLAIFIIVVLSVGTALGLFIKSSSKLTVASQAIFLPSMMLSGLMFPANSLPKFLEYLGQIFPTTWAYRILTGNYNFFSFLPLIIIFLIMAALCVFRLIRISKD